MTISIYKYIFSLILFAASSAVFSQIPDGYYNDATDKSGEELKAALYNIINGHTEYPYTDTSTDVWDILKEADKDPDNSNNVVGIYSGFSMDAAAEYNNGGGWSREHVWAKSRGDFGTSAGPGTDCHHLRAEDVSTNSARSNRNFDECSEPYTDASGTYSGSTGSFTSSTSYVWEPRSEIKGDVARMLFYMATRYEGENGEPDLELTETLQDQSSTEPLHAKLSVLLSWHEEDPVSNAERDRNEVVYSYQHNRNPFIDHPEYVACIWGGGCNTSSTTEATIILSNLVQDYDGLPKPITITTIPEGVNTFVLYGDTEEPPVEPGSYIVRVKIDDPDYYGESTLDVLTINEVTGTSDYELAQVVVYPNPAYNTTYLKANGEYALSVINSKGEVVLESSFINELEINTSKLARGIYLAKLTQNKNTFYIKIAVN